MRILVATLRKLVRRPATWVTLLLTVVLLALTFLALGAAARQLAEQPGGENVLLLVTFPDAYTIVLGFVLQLGGLLAVIYGAAVAGSEWSWGTLKVAVARGEARTWYLVWTFVAIVILLGFGLVISYLVGVVFAALGALLAGVSTAGLNDLEPLRELPEQLLRGWLALAEQAALGFAIATIARSQLAGVGVGIGAYFAESFVTIFQVDLLKYLPFSAASAVVPFAGSTSTGGITLPVLDPDVAVVVVSLYLVGALVVASVVTERAEIGG
jgi:ABC-2 type transport system permease protein